MGDDDWKLEKLNWLEAARQTGHTLELGEEGDVDTFAYSVEFCNGPRCVACGWVWCMHCEGPERIKPCSHPIIECTAVEIHPEERRLTHRSKD